VPRPTGNPQQIIGATASEQTEAAAESTPQGTQGPPAPQADPSPVKRRFHCPGSASFKLLYQSPIEAPPPMPGMPYQFAGRPGKYIQFTNHFYETSDPVEIAFIEHAKQSDMPLYIDGVKGVIRDSLAEAESSLAQLEVNVEAYKTMIRAGKSVPPGQMILQGVSFAGQDISPRPVSLMSPVSAPVGPGTDWNPALTK